MHDEWISITDRLPDEGVLVKTKIDDESGVRNFARLKRQGNLWFTSDGKMYVYYTPTHWFPLPPYEGGNSNAE